MNSLPKTADTKHGKYLIGAADTDLLIPVITFIW